MADVPVADEGLVGDLSAEESILDLQSKISELEKNVADLMEENQKILEQKKQAEV